MGTDDHNAGGGGGGVTLRWTSLPSMPGGSSNIPSRFILQKPELSAGLMDLHGRLQSLPYLTIPFL